jgi:hypothetical protein
VLTNAYYYTFYQPFIMQRRADTRFNARFAVKGEEREQGNDARVHHKITKNTAIKRSVTMFAEAVCRNITDMRDSARYLANNTDNYYSNVFNESLESSKEWVEEDISMFVNAFNAVVAFGYSQEHSSELTYYADNLREIAKENENELNAAGVSLHNNGMTMGFSAQRLHDINAQNFGQVVTGAAKTAGSVFDRTAELLHLPASAHMDFKQLSYYYNYRIDLSADVALRKIPIALYAGMVLDMVI